MTDIEMNGMNVRRSLSPRSMSPKGRREFRSDFRGRGRGNNIPIVFHGLGTLLKKHRG